MSFELPLNSAGSLSHEESMGLRFSRPSSRLVDPGKGAQLSESQFPYLEKG